MSKIKNGGRKGAKP